MCHRAILLVSCVEPARTTARACVAVSPATSRGVFAAVTIGTDVFAVANARLSVR
ncbi:hypothetical protein MYA_5805 [Burkholderia sp. KJ006]|nr:hypothetical protein MYA_5805 [Burkholderia sp. KJ006]